MQSFNGEGDRAVAGAVTPLHPPPAPPETHRVSFHGDGESFFVLLLKNVFLTIVTFGIYAAWARTARRKYLWNNVAVAGQRLGFTGTGKEVFIAYLKVLGVYLLVIGVFVGAAWVSPDLAIVVQLGLGLGLLVLAPYAIYWSRAYLLSRTTWRGIRFGLAGDASNFAGVFVGGYFATVFTLGIYGPFWINDMRRCLTNATRFGTEPFRYDGVGKEVFFIALKGFLLSLVTLGIYSFWMQASLQRYFFAHTSFGQARGRFAVTGGTLFKLFLLHLFGTSFSFGLAFPWIAVYSMKQILGGIWFEGQIDFARILQSQAAAPADGDAIADALDVGLGI